MQSFLQNYPYYYPGLQRSTDCTLYVYMCTCLCVIVWSVVQAFQCRIKHHEGP